MRNQIGEAASATAMLRLLEAELQSRLAEVPARGLDLVQHAGGRLETSYGDVQVGDLAEAAAGVSGNHLELRRRLPAQHEFTPDNGPMPAE